MNEILISIHTEFAKKIYTGEKRFELRKRAPNMTPGTRCWIYEPKPVGKVTGYFYYDGYLDGDKDMLWQQLHEHLGISKEQYYAYYKNQQHVYAWQISNQHRAKPRPLSDFGTRHAPQSYQRLLPSQKEKRQITDAAKTAISMTISRNSKKKSNKTDTLMDKEKLLKEIKKHFKPKDKIVIICHPKAEETIKHLAEEASLEIVAINSTQTDHLKEDQAIIKKAQETFFRKPEVNIEDLMPRMDNYFENKRHEEKLFQREQHKYASRFYRHK